MQGLIRKIKSHFMKNDIIQKISGCNYSLEKPFPHCSHGRKQMNAVICGQPVLEQAIMFSGMKEHNSRTYSNLSGTTVNRLYHCPAPEHLYSLPCRERKNIPPAHPGNLTHAAI